MSSTESAPRPRVEWMAVLDRIEASVAQSLARVDSPQSAPAAQAPGAPSPLASLDGRLLRMTTCLERAQQNAADTDALLVAETDALRQWLLSMSVARQRLQEWIDRSRG